MEYTGQYQRPAKGVMQTMELDGYKIECECHIDDRAINTDKDLDAREEFWIKTLKPELNTLPVGEGLNHPRIHYNREQILEVVHLWTTTSISVKDISTLTGVKYGTCHDIIHRRSHLWATEGIDMATYERKTIYRVWDPLGKVYEAKTFRELEEKTGISYGSLHNLVNSKTGVNHLGWSTRPPQVLNITDPFNNIHTTTNILAKTLLKDSGLSKYQIDRLLRDHKPSGGWKVTVCS